MADNEALEQAERLDYERFLLGSIIFGNARERMLDVLQIIPADHASYFVDPDNRATYSILCDLSLTERLPDDALLITNEIWDRMRVHRQDYPGCSFHAKQDVQRYVTTLGIESMPGMQMDAYKEYAERVKWANDRQAYVLLGTEIASKARNVPFTEREEFISDAESKVNTLSLEVRNSDGLRQVGGTTSSVHELISHMRRWEPIESGLKTGLDALDAITGGLNKGELCVLAASTGYGKSMLASTIGLNVAMDRKNPKSVMMFSLEMMDDQLSERAVANLARVNMKQFRREYENVVSGFYKRRYKDEMIEQAVRTKLLAQSERIEKAIAFYERLPLYTDITPALNANEIKSMVLQKQREIEHDGDKPPVGLIIVDYLQIMSPVENKSTNRTDEVGDMSRRLKRLAKETGIPVLCLAQLNRQAQDGEQPTLSMLRESGSIEQDADKVIFLWGENKGKREDDYTDVPPTEDAQTARRLACQRDKMHMKLTVAKNRQGEQGTCEMIGDYSFQYCCTQSDDYLESESFDMFFKKYYRNTRSGTDLFWPLPKDELPISDFQTIRHLKMPEMLYVAEDYTVMRTAADQAAEREKGPGLVTQTVGSQSANTQNTLVTQTAKMTATSPMSTQRKKMAGNAHSGFASDNGGNTKGTVTRRGSEASRDGMASFRPVVIDDITTDFEEDDEPIDFDELDDFGVNDGQ